MLIVAVAVSIYLSSIWVLFHRRSFLSSPVASFFNLFINGALSLNLVSTVVFFDTYVVSTAYIVYSFFLSISSVLFIIFCFTRNNLNYRVDSCGNNKALTKNILLLASLPFAFVAIKYLYFGILSGHSFGSPGWRSAVSSTSRGVEFLIYNSGVILFAIYIANFFRKNISHLFICLVYSFSLLLYGGRFLFVLSVLLGCFFRIHKLPDNFSFKKVLVLSSIVSAFVLGLAFLRYGFHGSGYFNNDIWRATVARQFSGNVYDFSLSYNYINESVASTLILEKLRVAAIPFLTKYSLSDTLGHYLAATAMCEFEFGHRITAIGEVYYLASYQGIVLLAMVSVFVCRFADTRHNGGFPDHVFKIITAFCITFLFFIDFGYVFTGLYMHLWFVLIFFCLKIKQDFNNKVFNRRGLV